MGAPPSMRSRRGCARASRIPTRAFHVHDVPLPASRPIRSARNGLLGPVRLILAAAFSSHDPPHLVCFSRRVQRPRGLRRAARDDRRASHRAHPRPDPPLAPCVRQRLDAARRRRTSGRTCDSTAHRARPSFSRLRVSAARGAPRTAGPASFSFSAAAGKRHARAVLRAGGVFRRARPRVRARRVSHHEQARRSPDFCVRDACSARCAGSARTPRSSASIPRASSPPAPRRARILRRPPPRSTALTTGRRPRRPSRAALTHCSSTTRRSISRASASATRPR